jgi:hypothetical protein
VLHTRTFLKDVRVMLSHTDFKDIWWGHHRLRYDYVDHFKTKGAAILYETYHWYIWWIGDRDTHTLINITKSNTRTLADFLCPLLVSLVATSPHLFPTTDGAAVADKGATATTER